MPVFIVYSSDYRSQYFYYFFLIILLHLFLFSIITCTFIDCFSFILSIYDKDKTFQFFLMSKFSCQQRNYLSDVNMNILLKGEEKRNGKGEVKENVGRKRIINSRK